MTAGLLKPTLALALTGLLLAACTTLQGKSNGNARNGNAETADPAERVADYEAFDPSPYAEAPPTANRDLQHQVPDRLMTGQATKGVARTVEGYRVQIFSTQEKRAAEEALSAATAWWEAAQKEAPSALSNEDLSAVIEYRQPYYRVRIGAFANRQRAERALDFVKEKYPDAFITRGTVTVTE